MSHLPWIGIDLGTSNCRVGVFRKNQFEIIPNEEGNYSTPCYVAFTDRECLVGEAAQRQATRNPRNTIYHFYHFLGRRISDPEIKQRMPWAPFRFIEVDQYLKFEVQYLNETRYFEPEEIAAILLKKMRILAEKYLGGPVSGVGMTSHAGHRRFELQCIKDAACIAGFEVVHFLDSACAVQIAHGFPENTSDQYTLIVDVGGGSTDVALINIEESVFNTVAVARVAYAGEAYTQRIMKELINLLKCDHKKETEESLARPRFLSRLLEASAYAKHNLSSAEMDRICIYALLDDVNFTLKLSRQRLEAWCYDLFQTILIPIKTVLKEESIPSIHKVILCGGSRHIPRIQTIIKEFFVGKPLQIVPDELQCYGVACRAALLSHGGDSSYLEKHPLIQALPNSVRFGTDTCFLGKIRRNTPLPTEQRFGEISVRFKDKGK